MAVAAARRETVERLAALIGAGRDDESPFPWAEIALDGEIDRLIAERPALEAEDIYRAILRDNRARDAAAGRTLIGPQASDLSVATARNNARRGAPRPASRRLCWSGWCWRMENWSRR